MSNATECVGCSEPRQLHPYQVTYRDGSSEQVSWCAGCAELARMDFTGEHQDVQPVLDQACAWEVMTVRHLMAKGIPEAKAVEVARNTATDPLG